MKQRMLKTLAMLGPVAVAGAFGLHRLQPGDAHGSPLSVVAPASYVSTTGVDLTPAKWTFQSSTLANLPALNAVTQNVGLRRPSSWKRSNLSGIQYEVAGGGVHADELRLQARLPGVAGAVDGASSPFALRTLGMARGTHATEFAQSEGDVVNRFEVRYARAEGVRESLKSVPGGVEQYWTFDHAPAGSGDLSMAVGFDPSFHVARSASDGVVLADATGAQVSYGGVAWVDANGTRYDLTPRAEGNRIVMTVPHEVLERSAYPAVLDPLVAPGTGGTPGYAPAAAGDATTGNYLACWEDYTTFATPRVYCRLYTPSTGATVATFRPSTGTSPQFEPVVERLSSGKFVVMWRDTRSGKSQVFYTTVNASSGGLLSADNRVTASGAASTLDQYSPAISCGVGNAAGTGSCIAVWGQMNANNVSEIYESRYDFNTSTGVVSASYYVGTVEQAGNTPQSVDNYAPTVQLLDPAAGAAFNAHIVWEKVVGANTRLRSAFVGRFPSACQCTKDSVAVSGQPAGFITSEGGDQFSPSLTYVTDTGSAPRTHGLLTYVSTQTGTREIFLRSVEAFQGGGCTSVALPNSMSAATQISSGGGSKDSATRLSCIAAGTSNACRVAYAVRNGAASSTVVVALTTTTTAPFISVGGVTTVASSASPTMLNTRLASQVSAGGNTGWLVLWDDTRVGAYQTYGARLNTAGAVLDAGGVKWSL